MPNKIRWSFKLDDFQKRAIDSVKRNQSILVSAPTGAGKTLIAEYVIMKCIEENKGVIYTAPIKALSNQKYREFQALFPEKTGIITGDVSINPHAPLLIMTTEIFRNKILDSPSQLTDYLWIIFDEIHYLDDIERGTVWEESLILLPKHMKIVGLSATIPNIDQFSLWLNEIHNHPIKVIKEDNRPVPLHFLFQYRGKIVGELSIIKKIAFSRRRILYQRKNELKGRFSGKNSPVPLIRHLIKSDRLPCLYFSFSRKRCEYLANRFMTFDVLTEKEKNKILEIYDSLCQRFNLINDERTQSLRNLVEKGIAYHHAGIHPMLKEVVEQLFTSKLIKIIFTTETFALGINMPARSVVIDEMRKRYGRNFRTLKVRDFLQMAGRGGRRGIDKEGYVYCRINPGELSFYELEQFFKIKPEPIRSRFNVSYATILNLYEAYKEDLFWIYSLSFYYFQEKKKSDLFQLKQMKTKLNILKKFGYIKSSKLTQKGHFAKNIYGHELPLSELYSSGILEELSHKQLGILCLAAVFEPRPDKKKVRLKNNINSIKLKTSRVVKRIHLIEKRNRVFSLSKKFCYDLSDSLLDWMGEKSFKNIVEEMEIDEGEVIRFYRMSIQILREMLHTPVSKNLKMKIQNAIDLINRGVINAEEQLLEIASTASS